MVAEVQVLVEWEEAAWAVVAGCFSKDGIVANVQRDLIFVVRSRRNRFRYADGVCPIRSWNARVNAL